MSNVQQRILEHLSAAGVLLAVGCQEPDAVAPVGTASPEPEPSTVNTAVVAEPEPTATATATGSAAAAGEVGAVCKTGADCQAGLHCALGFDGAKFSETGHCQVRPPVYRGRPLVIEGAPRVASLRGRTIPGTSDADDASWITYFSRGAAEEHASVAAFARTICQLMALGAPLDLLARTQRALADEIEHTRGSLAWLGRFGGGEPAPGPLAEAVAPLAPVAHADLARGLLVDVLRGGCVGETLAAEAMLERAARSSDAELAAWLEGVADDEARHAALAFETLAWLVRERPDLADVVREERARLPVAVGARLAPLFDGVLPHATS